MEQKKYIIVVAPNYHILEDYVNDAISHSYIPIGGVTRLYDESCPVAYGQAMILKGAF